MNNLKLSHPFAVWFTTLLLAAVAFISGVSAVSFLRSHSIDQDLAAVGSVEAYPKAFLLDSTTLVAKSAVVYDPANGTILFEKDADASLPLASLTKLMTATVVLEQETPETLVTIVASDLAPEGDWGFQLGDTVSLSNLLKIGLIASSNDAMQAAARSAGDYTTLMNREARDKGYTSMRFFNPTGLDESATTAGAYGSAYDIAHLAYAFFKLHPEYFDLTTNSQTVSIEVGGRTLSAQATSIPLQTLPGVIAAKTGYTDLAGGNLVVVFDIGVGHPLVAVVLDSTEEGRFSDMQTLINAARETN
ncbi:MAG TPA: hypothetical protein VG984_02795 [Candidatus Paceibacterota bacterium]|nr:hypothetical protein [Candidatus Paceibacterota bacterium]